MATETQLEIFAHKDKSFYGGGWSKLHLVDPTKHKTLCNCEVNGFDYKKLDPNKYLKQVDCKRCLNKVKGVKELETNKCNHKDRDGNWNVEKEDTRCDTDRGEYGGINYYCLSCEEDVTEEYVNDLEVKE